MPFLIRPSRRFPVQCYVHYSAGPFGAIVVSLAIQDDRPVPFLRRIPARMIGLGFRSEHVRAPLSSLYHDIAI
jgi:hypothetical protein